MGLLGCVGAAYLLALFPIGLLQCLRRLISLLIYVYYYFLTSVLQNSGTLIRIMPIISMMGTEALDLLQTRTEKAVSLITYNYDPSFTCSYRNVQRGELHYL